MKYLPFVLALGCVLLTPYPASAMNFLFMYNTPISKFKEDDLELFNTALMDALNEGQNGETTTWKNPKSGYHGEITLITTDAGECKIFRIINVADELKSNTRYRACWDEGAGWQIIPDT